MRKIEEYHTPALLKETIDFLEVKPGGKYIDATLGGGGHSQEIVRKEGKLLAIDTDPEAIEYAEQRLKKYVGQLTKDGSKVFSPKIVLENFIRIDEVAKREGFCQADGILFDLGVSSHQLEADWRGFSFNQNGVLDMRMNPDLAVTAKDLVNGLNQGELEQLFTRLGEEKLARRYAKAICAYRKNKQIITCDELAKIILAHASPRGRFDRTHPATRIFQALRIAVNDELNSLKEALLKSIPVLKSKGRIAVLSFHSLEDRIVKDFFIEQKEKNLLRIITDKPVEPNLQESVKNPRARSAKLRVAEKI